jgi:hypothetical protein
MYNLHIMHENKKEGGKKPKKKKKKLHAKPGGQINSVAMQNIDLNI